MNAPIISVASYRMQDNSVLQSQLTVGQIMTPRNAFVCALQGQSVADAFQDVPDVYDALPVVDGNDPSDITADVVGIIYRQDGMRAPVRQTVATHMHEHQGGGVCETMPLLDFATKGSVSKLALVTARNGSDICGLVTIYDLQRLPVRIALFAALTDLEEDIGGLLHRLAPDPSEWGELAHDPSGKNAKKIRESIKYADKRDDLGSPILTLSFGIKLALLEGLKNHGRLAGISIPNLHDIRNVRNDIAHGNPFKHIEGVPRAARNLRDLHFSVKTLIKRQP